MMKTLLFLFPLVMLTACEKNTDPLSPTERNLVGSWLYKEVAVDNGLKDKDVTDEYDDFRLTFDEDFSLVRYNLVTAESHTGTWKVNYVDAATTVQGSPVVGSSHYEMVAAVSDTTGEVMLIFWENFTAGGTTIKASLDGTYFELRKI